MSDYLPSPKPVDPHREDDPRDPRDPRDWPAPVWVLPTWPGLDAATVRAHEVLTCGRVGCISAASVWVAMSLGPDAQPAAFTEHPEALGG